MIKPTGMWNINIITKCLDCTQQIMLNLTFGKKIMNVWESSYGYIMTISVSISKGIIIIISYGVCYIITYFDILLSLCFFVVIVFFEWYPNRMTAE